jgi:uncharacterized protein (DUF2141 family)
MHLASALRAGLIVLVLALLPTVPLHAQSTAASAGPLTIHIVGLESDDGTVRIALNDEANYEGEGNVRTAALPIQDGTAEWTVDDVSPGTYAVRLYHDANGNEEMDTNMFGVPQEAFGFSNDARGRFGPPDFEEAAFTLGADSLSMTITAQ